MTLDNKHDNQGWQPKPAKRPRLSTYLSSEQQPRPVPITPENARSSSSGRPALDRLQPFLERIRANKQTSLSSVNQIQDSRPQVSKRCTSPPTTPTSPIIRKASSPKITDSLTCNALHSSPSSISISPTRSPLLYLRAPALSNTLTSARARYTLTPQSTTLRGILSRGAHLSLESADLDVDLPDFAEEEAALPSTEDIVDSSDEDSATPVAFGANSEHVPQQNTFNQLLDELDDTASDPASIPISSPALVTSPKPPLDTLCPRGRDAFAPISLRDISRKQASSKPSDATLITPIGASSRSRSRSPPRSPSISDTSPLSPSNQNSNKLLFLPQTSSLDEAIDDFADHEPHVILPPNV